MGDEADEVSCRMQAGFLDATEKRKLCRWWVLEVCEGLR